MTTEDDSVLVTIITDGEENCSEEYDLKMIKNQANAMHIKGEALGNVAFGIIYQSLLTTNYRKPKLMGK